MDVMNLMGTENGPDFAIFKEADCLLSIFIRLHSNHEIHSVPLVEIKKIPTAGNQRVFMAQDESPLVLLLQICASLLGGPCIKLL